jgi:cell division transport system ATP-binding protein
MIRFDGVYKTYRNQHEALRNVSFDINKGEFVFLTGRSGAGKSTLLRLIALMEHASSGEVIVDGRILQRLPRREIPFYRRQVGLIFQEHRLLPDRSVFENVSLPLVIAGYRASETQKRVRAALDKVGLLGKEASSPRTLSAGEQQRVGIARAVVNRPQILLADEPTGNLDIGLSLDILNLFTQFNDVGVTVLVATHNLDLLQHRKHRRLALVSGELSASA